MQKSPAGYTFPFLTTSEIVLPKVLTLHNVDPFFLQTLSIFFSVSLSNTLMVCLRSFQFLFCCPLPNVTCVSCHIIRFPVSNFCLSYLLLCNKTVKFSSLKKKEKKRFLTFLWINWVQQVDSCLGHQYAWCQITVSAGKNIRWSRCCGKQCSGSSKCKHGSSRQYTAILLLSIYQKELKAEVEQICVHLHW